MNCWLITYQVSRDNRMSWQTYNTVTLVTPADWLAAAYKGYINERVGYTEIVLLNAMTISEDEYKQLNKVLDQ
jgi:hypothetical protein